MDNEKKNNNYINLFDNKDLINGIRINIDSTKGALEAIKEIFLNLIKFFIVNFIRF